MTAAELTRKIRAEAGRLGFARVGFAPASESPGSRRLLDWLARGYHGEMAYMERDPAGRSDPRRRYPGARTVLSAALSYHIEAPPEAGPLEGSISRYAWGDDYHQRVRERLADLLAFIRRQDPGADGRICVDSSALLEKGWAARAGVGWQGKHSNTIVREAGNWIFLGEILLNRELVPDAPAGDFCGSCTRCLEACPTGAIVEPYVVDGRRCISYLTIELRGPIPDSLRPAIGNRIFGCDDCLAVCPWNKFRTPSPDDRFGPRPGNRNPDLERLAGMGPEEFRRRFRGSAVKRAKYEGLLRNVAVALGNSGSERAVPALRRLLAHSSPLVRSHAAWALGRIGTAEAKRALESTGGETRSPGGKGL